jgi:hypothetical protein
MKEPIIGTILQKIKKPVLSTSCNLLMVAVNNGIIVIIKIPMKKNERLSKVSAVTIIIK